ncbi:MAG TPA: hypothetical protein VIM58_12810, partial [Candidatus Methylacidiphilales bacterium]
LDPSGLPGTLPLQPHGGGPAVPWANGELPAAAKEAGGATWIWDKADAAPRFFVALARQGIRLTVDGQSVVDCPAGLPYVPATHRCPEGSRAKEAFAPGVHEVRIDLPSRDPQQEASVILAYPNLHIAPWTKDELPDAALLPDA